MNVKRWKQIGIGMVAIVACVLVGCSLAKKEEEKNSDAVVINKSSDAKKESTTKEDTSKKEEKEEQKQEQESEDKRVTCIGDSVMLGAKEEMIRLIPEVTVDAKESRQLTQAQALVKELKEAGTLGGTVVIGLGTNGPFSEEDGQALLDEIGSERKIFWVTVYGKDLSIQDSVNQTIQTLAETNDNVVLLQWNTHAAGHDEWFYNDGVHLNGAGRTAYAEFVKDAVE